MKYIKKISNYAIVGGLGATLIMGLTGCEEKPKEEPKTDTTSMSEAQKKGAFVILEEVKKGEYKIQDEFPAKETKIVLKDINGTERVLTKEEIDKLIKEENAKIENGTSNLTKPANESVSSGGLSLGETILASAAGAIIGSWIGSKLFGNQNYQNQRRASYKSPSTYSRSVNSFNKTKATSSTSSTAKKSGFFNKSSSPTSSSSSSTSKFGG